MNQEKPNIPEVYPYEREWCIESIDISRYKNIQENWQQSQEILNSVREKLESSAIDNSVIAIAAAGSLGRMEARKDISDADLIVIIRGDISPDSDQAKQAYNSVWEIVSSLNIAKPKPTGVFAQPTNVSELLTNIGKAQEEYQVFSKRLLLLLETQPLYNKEEYAKIISEVVDRYAQGYVMDDPKKEWTFLLNDLIRYFRSLAVNYQSDFENDSFKWLLRNIKLRHSRVVMYSSLLMLLGEASQERENKVEWLKKRLKMTPLERLAWVYEQNKDWNFYRIARVYDVFLSYLNDPELREELQLPENTKIDFYKDRYSNRTFSTLKANSDSLVAELLRFVIGRRGVWTERFFEYLIF